MITRDANLIATLEDPALMASVGLRDQRALQTLYERHAPTVHGLACRISGSPAIAEEVVQEVFLRLWNDPQRFDPARGALRSFLYREAHSRSIERLRSESARRQREARDEREIDAPAPDVEAEVLSLVRDKRVREALLELSDGEREAIHLAYFGGHTYREVATRLGVAEGTVKSRIRLGLKRLAGALHDFEMGDPR